MPPFHLHLFFAFAVVSGRLLLSPFGWLPGPGLRGRPAGRPGLACARHRQPCPLRLLPLAPGQARPGSGAVRAPRPGSLRPGPGQARVRVVRSGQGQAVRPGPGQARVRPGCRLALFAIFQGGLWLCLVRLVPGQPGSEAFVRSGQAGQLPLVRVIHPSHPSVNNNQVWQARSSSSGQVIRPSIHRRPGWALPGRVRSSAFAEGFIAICLPPFLSVPPIVRPSIRPSRPFVSFSFAAVLPSFAVFAVCRFIYLPLRLGRPGSGSSGSSGSGQTSP